MRNRIFDTFALSCMYVLLVKVVMLRISCLIAESEKIHVPLGKGFSFSISHSYRGKAMLRCVLILNFHINPQGLIVIYDFEIFLLLVFFKIYIDKI